MVVLNIGARETAGLAYVVLCNLVVLYPQVLERSLEHALQNS